MNNKQKALAFETCQFEMFEGKKRTVCGKPATYRVGDVPLCDDCAIQARGRGKEPVPVTFEKE